MTTAAQKKALIKEAANRVAMGYSDHDVREWLRSDRGVSRATAYRILNAVHAEQARRISKQRPVLAARQSAKLDAAQRAAMIAKRRVVVDKQLEEFPDPDVSAFVRAVEAQNRLLGLNAPEHRVHMIANVQGFASDVAELAWQFIPDQQRRRDFLEALKKRLTQRLAAKESLRIEEG